MITDQLPSPDTDALQHSAKLAAHIHSFIANAGGSVSFANYMEAVLYTPGLGYYSGGAKKFGQAGDFVTAPEISPLFAQTVARQVAEVLDITQGEILELGAGTGRLACDLLKSLQALDMLPARYSILEVSADLRAVQQSSIERLLPPELAQKVCWLDSLPEEFSGVVLANEVLDALPVHIAHQTERGLMERTVATDGKGFTWAESVANGQLKKIAESLNLPVGYITEINLAATGLINSLASMLQQGLILMVDYGFSRQEYYHPQRSQGTLMCHYRHYAHGDPFLYPGLQDVTAHVDFTGVAEAAAANQLELAGYCSQAQFLINCGITDILAAVSPHDMARYAPLASQAQKLLSPAEMGELFKVIAMTKALELPLLGFTQGDKRYTL